MLRRVCLLALLTPALVGFGGPALIESHAARARVTEPVVRQITASLPPAVATRAGVLIDAADGQVLWAREAERRLPIASTTKIMTAVVALERLPVSATVRVRSGAGEFPGQSVAGLRAGDELPLIDALHALMLPSGNDAAVAIAQAAGGSTEAFVQLMNRRAADLGLRDTRFANPHGLDAPEHYSTARDLARLTRVALENGTLAQVVATKEHVARGYRWTNLNRLLWLRPDATGVKTGTTEGSGQALVASARRGDRRTVAVVLDAADRWVASDRLLDHFFEGHAPVALDLPPSPFHRGLRATGARAVTVPVWQSGLLSARVRLGEGGVGDVVEYEVAGRSFGQAALQRP